MSACLWTLLALGLVGLVGCAEPPFSVHAQDNQLTTLRPTLGRLPRAAAASASEPALASGDAQSGSAMVYILAGPDSRAKKDQPAVEKTLYGFDLQSGQLAFAIASDARSRFAVTKGLLVYREGNSELVLREPHSGAPLGRVKIPTDETLVGLVADDGGVYYVTRSQDDRQGPGQRRSHITALSARGEPKWRISTSGSVGAPAVKGGLLALPFRYQEVVILDAQTGSELTRIRQKDDQIGFVQAAENGIYYGVGEKGVALLTESSVQAKKADIAYAEPQLGDRARVALNWDGYRPEQAYFGALDRNRLLWEGALQGDHRLEFRDHQVIWHSYRFFFSVHTGGGAVRWAYAHPRQNLMASELTDKNVLFVAQDGEIGALDRNTGARIFEKRVTLKPGQQVLGATFAASGFAPSAAATPAAVAALPSVLHEIIFDKDSSFLSVKLFAVQALWNRSEGDGAWQREATAELLRIITAEGLPPQLARAAGETLLKSGNRQAGELIAAALAQSYDFLQDRRPRGLDILAQVAAALEATQTVPVLIERLLDPSTPQTALKEIVAALIALHRPSAFDSSDGKTVAALRNLLLLYRSDPVFRNDPMSLFRAAQGLLQLDGAAGRRTVQFAALQPSTLMPLRAQFRKLLDDSVPPLTPMVFDSSKAP